MSAADTDSAKVGSASFDTLVNTRICLARPAPDSQRGRLIRRANAQQWDIDQIDWERSIPFGDALPVDSAFGLSVMAESPLAGAGIEAWDRFRWEFQSWLVCQVLHGEQAALIASARLAQSAPDVESKMLAASQANDEARHLEAFGKYVDENIPEPYPLSEATFELLDLALAARTWDLTTLAVHIVIEPIALAVFRLADRAFHDPVLRQITRLAQRDEARHVAFGVEILGEVLPELSAAERGERAEFVLEAMRMMRQRFLLAEIWQRIGVETEAGTTFVDSHPIFVEHRRLLFSQVVAALRRLNLMEGRVEDELVRQGIIRSPRATT